VAAAKKKKSRPDSSNVYATTRAISTLKLIDEKRPDSQGPFFFRKNAVTMHNASAFHEN